MSAISNFYGDWLAPDTFPDDGITRGFYFFDNILNKLVNEASVIERKNNEVKTKK